VLTDKCDARACSLANRLFQESNDADGCGVAGDDCGDAVFDG